MVTDPARAEHVPVVALGGCLLVLSAVGLYISELSRAVALVLLPYAACLLGAAGYAQHDGRWPHRWLMVAFWMLVVAGIGYGAALVVYSLMHQPSAA